MNQETVFFIANTLVLPQWLLMVFAPNLGITQWLIRSFFIPLILAVLYAFYIFSGMNNLDFSAFSTFQSVMDLFTVKEAVLAGWIHYLCFDLITGGWILSDSQKRGVRHLLVIPCLFFCFMLGPIGILIYLIIRKIG
jgi:Domain of unknown function (DUF4281)